MKFCTIFSFIRLGGVASKGREYTGSSEEA